MHIPHDHFLRTGALIKLMHQEIVSPRFENVLFFAASKSTDLYVLHRKKMKRRPPSLPPSKNKTKNKKKQKKKKKPKRLQKASIYASMEKGS